MPPKSKEQILENINQDSREIWRNLDKFDRAEKETIEGLKPIAEALKNLSNHSDALKDILPGAVLSPLTIDAKSCDKIRTDFEKDFNKMYASAKKMGKEAHKKADKFSASNAKKYHKAVSDDMSKFEAYFKSIIKIAGKIEKLLAAIKKNQKKVEEAVKDIKKIVKKLETMQSLRTVIRNSQKNLKDMESSVNSTGQNIADFAKAKS